jgi:PadR family transcriptional regulator, regulatory protein PadR
MFDDENFTSPHGFGRGSGRGRGRGRGRRWMGEYSLVDVRLVEPALLAFLNQEDLHGYGLLEKLEPLGLGAINPSVIYRILRDYEDIGLVRSDWDKDSTQGPPRRVYSLTEEGAAALKRAYSSLKDTVTRINQIIALIDNSSG